MRSFGPTSQAIVTSLLVLVLVVSLGTLWVPMPDVGATQTTPDSSPAATPAADPVTIPQTAAGDQLQWVIDQLNGDPAALTDAEIEERFAAAFLAQVPVGQIREITTELAEAAPWSFVSVTEEQGSSFLVAIVRNADGALQVTIAVEEAAPHEIVGLLFAPAPAVSWDEVDAALTPLGPAIGFVAAELTDAGCQSLHEIGADRRLAIGSTFKLYVLGELARQVAAGEAAWDELLPIQERYKSLPSGDLRHVADGTEFTLRYYAETMIAHSDNTATDHLIVRLGRENVEAMMATMGHGEPAVNTPFLTTRELFILKLVLTEEEQQAYLAATAAERRTMLDTEIAATDLPGLDVVGSFTAPLLIEELEWFASANELCHAMAYLFAIGQEPGLRPVVEVMSLGVPIAVDRATWPIVLFKGGSEPGVISGTFLLLRNDGRPFVLTATVTNPDEQVDANAVFGVVQAAVGLLGQA